MSLYADRLLPHDIEAEEAVIGSLLIDGECFPRIAPLLKAEDFYRERNALCYTAASALFQRSQAIDQTTLASELARTEQLDAVGGMAYLSHLVAITPTSAHAEDYADIVLRTSTMRKLISAAARISELGYNDTDDVSGTLAKAQDLLSLVQGPASDDLRSLRDIYDEYLREISGVESHDFGIMTGIHGLDELTAGIPAGSMVVIGARPSMGKTSLALNIAAHTAREGRRVAFMSLEMEWNEIAVRLLAAEANVRGWFLRHGLYSEREYQEMIEGVGRLSDLPMRIGFRGVHTVADVRAKAVRMANEDGLDLLVVDYLQLMYGPGGRNTNRAQEISVITRELKGLARDLQCVVIACSQLNREVEGRPDHRPRLSDLRESGSIEQDADIVVLIHREEMYGSDSGLGRVYPSHPQPERLAELIVAKNRQGPLGDVVCDFDGAYWTFSNVYAESQFAGRS